LLAERIAHEAGMDGQPLGKEVLQEFMLIFRAKALELMDQQIPVEQQADGSVKQVTELVKERDEQVERYSKLAMYAASQVAPYQSPTLKATFVQHDFRNRQAENEEARAFPVEQQASGQVKQVEEFVKERDAKVERYGMLAVECATRLAQYQSPRLRATFVQVDNSANREMENAEATAELERILSGRLRGRRLIDVTPVTAKNERNGEEHFTPKLVVPRSR
jgi:hypothetical protein